MVDTTNIPGGWVNVKLDNGDTLIYNGGAFTLTESQAHKFFDMATDGMANWKDAIPGMLFPDDQENVHITINQYIKALVFFCGGKCDLRYVEDERGKGIEVSHKGYYHYCGA